MTVTCKSSESKAMSRAGDLTKGGITGTLLRFTLPMIAGALHTHNKSTAFAHTGKEILETGPAHYPRNRSLLGSDMYPAVCNESGHTVCTGACKQFRDNCNGCICSCCQNRLIRIYACPGIREFVFDFRSPELRSRQAGQDKKRHSERTLHYGGIFAYSVCLRIHFCRSTYAYFCRRM